MDPIPETASLIDELSTFYNGDLLGDLQRQAEAVRELVPDLVGLSVAAFRDDVTFTLVASDHEVAVLDALQYLAGGPCVDAAHAERVLEYDLAGPDDEGRWHAFAKAGAAKAVATTLTLPILDGAPWSARSTSTQPPAARFAVCTERSPTSSTPGRLEPSPTPTCP